jgi:hypothetical protein
MKAFGLSLIGALLVASSGPAVAQTVILTFDDLVPGSLPGADAPYEGPIPNAYDGFQWNNFGVIDNTLSSTVSGYNNAVISPNNVAFNERGNPALVSDGFFNLNSAYLTAAWNDGLQVEVQGFIGANMVYDNTYTFDTTGATLVSFNYLGIDSTKFISSGGVPHGYAGRGTQFAMDNLSVTLVPEPSAFGLLGMASCFWLLLAGRYHKSKKCDFLIITWK